MDQEKARALSEYLDDLLQGKNPSIAGMDEEVKALGELGRSLAEIELKPGPAHQAHVDRLLQKHRPTFQTGGTAMIRMILGIPVKWLLGLFALLAGATVTGGVILVVVLTVQKRRRLRV
jgi:hypothetical protein